MVPSISEGRLNDPSGHGKPQPHATRAALVIVALIGVGVLLAKAALSLEAGTTVLVWFVVAVVAFAAVRRHLRKAEGASEQAADVSLRTPVVIRRDGTAVHNEVRRHRRFVPARRATTLHMRDGRQVAARIVDISIAGVSVEARLTELDLLAIHKVGTRVAGPIRRTQKGAVFGFETLLDPQPFDASFVL